MMDCDKQKDDYEKMSSDLMQWIQQKVAVLNDRRFPNSMEGIQHELVKFKEYRTEEKPPKYAELKTAIYFSNLTLVFLNAIQFVSCYWICLVPFFRIIMS